MEKIENLIEQLWEKVTVKNDMRPKKKSKRQY